MLQFLHVIKIEPSNYRAHVFDGREELGEFGAPHIDAAICQCAGPVPVYHGWYENVCAGTVTAGRDARSR